MGKCQQKNVWLFVAAMSTKCAPNGLRYPLVGWTRQRHFDGTSFEPWELLEKRARREVAVPLVGCTPRSVPEGAFPEWGYVQH